MRGGEERGIDAAAWMEMQRARGHHTVHFTAGGIFVAHPDCSDLEACPFGNLETKRIRKPTGRHPYYVAEVDKDGTIGPVDHASWGDVVATAGGPRA